MPLEVVLKSDLILDDYGSTASDSQRKISAALVAHLIEEGVEVKIFNEIDKRALLHPKRFLKRMHEKLVLFRGQQAFIMGDRDCIWSLFWA